MCCVNVVNYVYVVSLELMFVRCKRLNVGVLMFACGC